MPRKLDLPSPEEDAAIQRGIAQDLENPELGSSFFEHARPAGTVMPPALLAELAAPAPERDDGSPGQVQLMLLVDQDVFEGLQAAGPDLQAKVNAALRKVVAS